MLLIMHNIVLCTPCIALFNCDHLLHIQVDHVEPKTENQKEQVQWVFGDPQTLSCEDTDILRIKASPVHLTTFLEFGLSLYLVYDSWMCIRS
jgi:hypothetical protein